MLCRGNAGTDAVVMLDQQRGKGSSPAEARTMVRRRRRQRASSGVAWYYSFGVETGKQDDGDGAGEHYYTGAAGALPE